jgi:hypothetical protein
LDFLFLGEFLHIGDRKGSGGVNDTKDLLGGVGPSRNIRIEFFLKSPYLDNKFELGAKI